jgi:hypothetical protein
VVVKPESEGSDGSIDWDKAAKSSEKDVNATPSPTVKQEGIEPEYKAQ